MPVYVYVEHDRGARHLTTHKRIATESQPTTLCGRRIRWSQWHEQDETVSGIEATCRTCKRIIHAAHTQEDS